MTKKSGSYLVMVALVLVALTQTASASIRIDVPDAACTGGLIAGAIAGLVALSRVFRH